VVSEFVTFTERDVKSAVRAARALPADLRRALVRDVSRQVVSPVARQVQIAAGRSSVHATRAFRSRGVLVKPGEEPTLVVGGPEAYGRTTMRRIAQGAEWGGGAKRTTYSRKGRKVGRKRSGSHQVTRRTTAQFGGPEREGRFVRPTMLREVPKMTEAYLAIIARVTEEVWDRGR
jgi:hypothetical protein